MKDKFGVPAIEGKLPTSPFRANFLIADNPPRGRDWYNLAETSLPRAQS
jgi:hypothetical protein